MGEGRCFLLQERFAAGYTYERYGESGCFFYDVLLFHGAATRSCIACIAVSAVQVAAGQPDENTGKPLQGGFSLDAGKYLRYFHSSCQMVDDCLTTGATLRIMVLFFYRPSCVQKGTIAFTMYDFRFTILAWLTCINRKSYFVNRTLSNIAVYGVLVKYCLWRSDENCYWGGPRRV